MSTVNAPVCAMVLYTWNFSCTFQKQEVLRFITELLLFSGDIYREDLINNLKFDYTKYKVFDDEFKNMAVELSKFKGLIKDSKRT